MKFSHFFLVIGERWVSFHSFPTVLSHIHQKDLKNRLLFGVVITNVPFFLSTLWTSSKAFLGFLTCSITSIAVTTSNLLPGKGIFSMSPILKSNSMSHGSMSMPCPYPTCLRKLPSLTHLAGLPQPTSSSFFPLLLISLFTSLYLP